MTTASENKLPLLALRNASIVLLVGVVLVFGALSPRFLEVNNLVNILVQSASILIVAIGMTFVLLTAGIDLSVGAIMFVSAAVAGKMVLDDVPLPLTLLAAVLVGLVFGAVNAFFVARLGVLAFVVTLATLYMGRGLGLWITETRAMNLPPGLLELGTARILGVPSPVVIVAVVLLVGHVTLTRTPFGRQIYAVGNDREAATKAGIDTTRVLAAVYVISGVCAAVGGIVSVAQLGAVSPTFGNQREFAAIAAAVLGGTSLFGGRGSLVPGTALGAVLIQTIENGLVIVNADPYLYPLVTSAVIFLAVLVDSTQYSMIQKLGRRKIRTHKTSA